MKFFIDHNLSAYLARALGELSRPHGIIVEPKKDRFPLTTPDKEWIEELAKEGDWSIVTHDRLTKNPIEKEALRSSGLVAFILNKSWSNQREWDKAAQMVRWWPRIIEISELVTGGAVFMVPWRVSGKGKFEQLKL